MSFVLGIYDLTAWLIPGFMYLFLINEFLGLFNLRNITSADIQNGLTWIGLALIAFLLGFLSLAIFDQYWFSKHWPRAEEGLNRIKQRYPELEIKFETEDWRLLYPILKQRVGSNNSLEHAERFNAFSMMSRNLVGVFSFGAIHHIVKLIISDFNIPQFLFVFLLIILAAIAYKTHIWYWNKCMERFFGHVIAYGNNMESYLGNDQPRWFPQDNGKEK